MKGNGEKYKELIEKVETAQTTKTKIDILALLVNMMATNDLEAIYSNLGSMDKQLKKIWIGIVVILLLAFFSNGKIVEAMSFIAAFVGRI